MKPQKDNIKKLITSISRGLYEREHIIALTLLAAIAGESVFLLGLPGVAKSLIGRRLKMAFKDASSFEYLMSRFSTPDEIFGPVSISKLKDEDTYERIVDGYLPTADVIFLDEIWKTGPSIQNSLLTVLNEKIYRNGRTEIALPLKGIIAASNELPASNEGLEALWDRFLIRLIVDGIQDEKAFNSMISATSEMRVEVNEELPITSTQYVEWQGLIDKMVVPPFVFEIISAIRKEINHLNIKGTEATELDPIIISDRRWKKIIRLLRASALLNERVDIAISDLLILSSCLWDNELQIEYVEDILNKAILTHLLADWVERRNEIEEKIKELRTVASNGKSDDYMLFDDKHYSVVGFNEGNTYITKDFYNELSERLPKEAAMTTTKLVQDRYLQAYPRNSVAPKITILKSKTGIKINGRDYRMIRQDDLDQIADPHFQEWVEAVAERAIALHADFKSFQAHMKTQFIENLFVADSQCKLILDELKRFEMTLRKMLSLLNNG